MEKCAAAMRNTPNIAATGAGVFLLGQEGHAMETETALPTAPDTVGGLPSIPDIFNSVVGLVTPGANGLAAIIFVSVMIVMVFSLILGARMTPVLAGLTKWFLALGTFCVVISLVSNLTERYLSASYNLHVSISPSLRVAGLPDPVIRADTQVVNLDEIFSVDDNIGITVMIDEIIRVVRERDVAVAATVEQANAVVVQNSQLKETLAEQTQQLESVRSSFEAVQARLDATGPAWAGGQLDALATDLKAISAPPVAINLPAAPLVVPDELLLAPANFP
jgi:hypothetical protein